MPSATRLRRNDLHRFAGGRVEARELIAEIIQLELQALRDQQRVFDGLGKIVEEAAHGAGASHLTLRVGLQETARFIERDMMADGREHIQHFAFVLRGIANAVGRKDGQTQALGDAERRLVAGLFGTVAVTLQFHVDVAAAEDVDQLLHALPACVFTSVVERRSQRAFVASGKADQTMQKLRQDRCQGAPFALVRLAHLEAGNELAKVLVADARRAKQWKTDRLRTYAGEAATRAV